MITYLTDSDWVVDYLSGKGEAFGVLRPLIQQGRLAISIIAYGEVYEGLFDNRDRAERLTSLNDIVSGVPILGLDMRTSHIFAELRADLRSRGQLIPDHDLWIAATALRYDLTLVSRDRHFERIPSLKRQ